MRNLKKLLALVVACVMVFGVVASAAVVNFPDVDSTAKYAEAVKVLSALNIINGDDKGNFNPDQNVTRAEMAKILCALVGKSTAGQTATKFDDVTAEHWASGYVAYAAGLGYINGYNDKEFGPEDQVTYEQAIKLIVAALGYTYMAVDQGGYPSGYMMVAADLKITNKVTITDSKAPAKRSDIAMLAYNALEVNLMERVTYGTEAKYEPVAKNLLNNKLGVYRVEGMVINTFKNDTSMDEGEIDYDITKVDANTVKALGLEDLNPAENVAEYALNDYYSADASAADLLYYASNAYLGENEAGDYDVIAVVAKTTKTKELFIDDIKKLCDEVAPEVDEDEVMDIANGVFSYWSTTAHEDKRPTVIEVAEGAKVTVNNGTPFEVTDNDDVIPAYAGTIKVIDTNNDGKYDLFVVKSYQIAVVDSVIASSMTVRFKSRNGDTVNTANVRSIALNEDAVENMKELTVTIDGAAAELTDLAKNDVVLFASNGTYGGSFDPTFVEIHATRKVIEGKVKSGINDDGFVEIAVGDETKDYEVFPSLVSDFAEPGDTGVFYLTSTDVVVYSDTVATMSNKYAYVYKVGESTFGDKSLRMLTATEGDMTYDVADRIEINGVPTSNKKANTKYTAAEMVAMFGGVEADYYVAPVEDDPATDEDETFAGVNNLMSPEDIIAALVDSEDPEMKLVAYDVSGNELTELYIATGSAFDEDDFGTTGTVLNAEWIASTNKFKSSKTLAEGAKIFMIEADAEYADWKVVDAATLINEKTYDVAFYGYNANGSYNAALITSGTMAADTEAAFAYFKEARTTTYGDDDEDAKKVYFIQGGEEKTMFVLDSEGMPALTEGDIFIYSVADDANLMENVTKLATPIANEETALFAGTTTAATFQTFVPSAMGTDYIYTGSDIDADNEVMGGIIVAADTVEGGLKVKLAVDEDVVGSDYVYMIPEKANVVVLNNKVSKNRLYASTVDSILPSEYVALDNNNIDTAAENAEDTKLYYAIIRLFNDEVVDVYVINYENNM